MSKFMNDLARAASEVEITFRALKLHYNPSTEYSYPDSGGRVKFSMDNFIANTKSFKYHINLRTMGARADSFERFMFANYLYKNPDYLHAMVFGETPIKVYRDWEDSFGSAEKFESSCIGILKAHGYWNSDVGSSIPTCFDGKDTMDIVVGAFKDVEMLNAAVYLYKNGLLDEDVLQSPIVGKAVYHIKQTYLMYKYFCIC